MSSILQKPFRAIIGIALLLPAALAVWLGLRADSVPAGATPERPIPAASVPSASIPTEKNTAALAQMLEEIENEPDSLERPGLLLDLMIAASMTEVEALLAASDDGYSPAFRDEIKAAAYERWFALDPAGALRAIDKSTMGSPKKMHMMEVFLDEWSGREPDQVSAFLKEEELRGIPVDKAYGAIARGASLAGAVELVDSALSRIGDAKLKSYAVRAAARILQRNHDALFDDWLAALPAAHQGAALAESAWILTETNIERALSNLNRLEQLDAERVPVTRARMVVKWAGKHPAQAADWVASQKLRDEEREALFADVLGVWFSEDRDVAVAWVESLIARGAIDEAFMNRVASKL